MIKDVEPLLKECEEALTDLKGLGDIEAACYVQGFVNSINALPEVERGHREWIPLKYRPMDEDEYRAFSKEYGFLPVEERKMFDCQMPEDGQEILISTKYGHIFLDTCVHDDCYGLEEYGDWDDVLAWMPLPEPYKRGEAE